MLRSILFIYSSNLEGHISVKANRYDAFSSGQLNEPKKSPHANLHAGTFIHNAVPPGLKTSSSTRTVLTRRTRSNSKTVLHVHALTGFHQPPALYNREHATLLQSLQCLKTIQTIVPNLFVMSIYHTTISEICYNSLDLGGRLSEGMDRTIK